MFTNSTPPASRATEYTNGFVTNSRLDTTVAAPTSADVYVNWEPLDWVYMGTVKAVRGLSYVNVSQLYRGEGAFIGNSSTNDTAVGRLERGDVVVIGNETHTVGENGMMKDFDEVWCVWTGTWGE